MDGETLFFLFYVGVLALSGILMLVLSAIGAGATVGSRVLNAVLGLAALAYAVYLIMTVFIDGGTYRIFIYAFILPVFAIIQLVKTFKARAEQKAAAAMPQSQYMPQAPQVPQASPVQQSQQWQQQSQQAPHGPQASQPPQA